tara:strand:- start:61 stop:324 length:264 start_codon:yes stop_codon:yes gene_type:complete
MNKKERYINYIVDDLVKKTEIDYDRDLIKLPFLTPPFLSYPSTYLYPYHFPFSSFSNHVRKVYGAHSEEINIIWNLYKDRLHSLIKK